jgi:hypothetical protein
MVKSGSVTLLRVQMSMQIDDTCISQRRQYAVQYLVLRRSRGYGAGKIAVVSWNGSTASMCQAEYV